MMPLAKGGRKILPQRTCGPELECQGYAYLFEDSDKQIHSAHPAVREI